MALVRTFLLGSAATLLAASSALTADLPAHKAEPAASFRICGVGGLTGWVLPGSDTCVRLSGYMTAQVEGGNLSPQYNWAFAWPNQRILLAASDFQRNTIFYRDAVGWTTRANFGFDIVSNTAWGPLIGHFDVNADSGNGFDAAGNDTYLNTGYVTWAGLTAGKAASFFSFTAGGDNWASFFSPDRKGYNQPLLIAYTGSFRGGLSATLSFESPGAVGASGPGTDISACSNGYCNIDFGGQRWPDVVGALHVRQSWGEAQLSGVLHNVNVQDSAFYGAVACGSSGALPCNGSQDKIGWGVDAGVSLNLPWQSTFLLTGAYSQSAIWYSGLPDGIWGENGQVNGNGQPMFLADAAFDPVANAWATPTAWSVTTLFEHHFAPTVYGNLEGSVGGLNWSGQGGGCPLYAACDGALIPGGLSPHSTSWIVGAGLGWNPAANLNFDLELMHQYTIQETPSGLVGTIYNWQSDDGAGAVFVPGAWNGVSSGFAGRFRLTRYF